MHLLLRTSPTDEFEVNLSRAASALGLAAIAGSALWIAYSKLGIDHDVSLPHAVSAERRTFPSDAAGVVSFYADDRGSGPPLIFVHSVNAAASAYEMRPLFEHYRGSRPVFAIDLPGFGFSERAPRRYTPELYADVLADFFARVAGHEPADVIALSLSSEFAARAALQRPDRVRSLTLISPTGLSSDAPKREATRASRERSVARRERLLRVPLVGKALYDLLVTRPSILYFLQKSFAGRLNEGLAEHAFAASHREGARYAPLAFLGGGLFTPDVKEAIYERLEVPVLVLYDEDPYTDFDALDDVCWNKDNWREARIPKTRGMPHFEKLGDVIAVLDRFYTKLERGAPARTTALAST